MPELPEVEIVKETISPHLISTKILNISYSTKNLRKQSDKQEFNNIINSTIQNISRKAKYILIFLSTEHILVIHLGMTGKIIICNPQHNNWQKYHNNKHTHITLELSNEKSMFFHDVRRFGMMFIIHNDKLSQHENIKNLGIEPLSNHFDGKILQNTIQSKKSSIKSAIMNQNLIVGVGNIYACESLFLSKISPHRICKNISEIEYHTLADNIKLVLSKALKSGGSTLKDFANVDDTSGNFQDYFQVYNRENQLCYNCNYTISREKQHGRSTYFCNNCQK